MRSKSTSTGTLLLTGATGMVGSYVMAQWLRLGQPLAVIARGKGTQNAAERIEQILSRFEQAWNVALDRPRVFQGDLNQPGLGLLTENTRWIAENCRQILHSAASLSFAPASESADNEPYRTNVDGTAHVLDFCREANLSRFHHVSTAYVCGQRSGTVLESELDIGQSFANDYERSKSMAEAMLREAWQAGNLDSLTIYRPSIVIDRTGLSPVSGDRTIYGAFSMYQMLASRFGLPDHGQWFRNLGFDGTEQKNIVDVDWIADAILAVISTPHYHDQTYHLTSQSGTTVSDLDGAFRTATQAWLSRPTRVSRRPSNRPASPRLNADEKSELDRMAAPFVKTFLPYFRDDPSFGRHHIDRVIAETELAPTPEIRTDELLEMVRHWSAFTSSAAERKPRRDVSTDNSADPKTQTIPQASQARGSGSAAESGKTAKSGSTAESEFAPSTAHAEGSDHDGDEIVVCGYEVRLPGGVDNAHDFANLLWQGRSGVALMPEDRLDRSLYFDTERNLPGKTYTELGGCVAPEPLDAERERRINAVGDFDLTHRQFAQVAMAAVQSAFGVETIDALAGLDPQRAGVLVGHSGGTQSGGPLAMSTLASATSELIEETDLGQRMDSTGIDRLKADLTAAIRRGRPSWQSDRSPSFNAYSAASLAAGLIGFRGRREVIDAACSSSLLALHHAVSAITADHLDVAVVGGATFNNVDNLALFSQSGACSDEGCYPFDRRASGLISSEGYVAIVLVRRSVAERLGLPIHAAVAGVGVASDGKGKGLWAPRSEGQQLAIRRGASAAEATLDVDYLECHATSTQVGDATELETLKAILRSEPESGSRPPSQTALAIGSVKSNLGHLLEAAGLVGMVKCLISMQKGQLPPSIHFEQPNETYDWTDSPVRVVDSIEPWPRRNASGSRVAGVNAFGIGGLNAHVVIRQSDRAGQTSRRSGVERQVPEPIAIVGRGLVLPGAKNLAELAERLKSDKSCIGDPPPGRWPQRSRDRGWIGVDQTAALGADYDGRIPHCRGGYIRDFDFDAQGYRIPPKTVRYANPAQLMLIQAAAQAIEEFDGGTWSVDRTRVGVVVGTIFGGEFSNALQIGLRLPEVRKHFLEIARREGVSDETMQPIVEQFHEAVMQRYPALLDETGGFTASTLASRLTRTFDLMGGACAVDADEASGGLAIVTAMEQLRRGQVDTVLCGTTHRSMDLVAFEQLHRKCLLVQSGQPEDLPADGSQIFPGEGVAIMMLQRFSDAVAQNQPIFGVLEHAAESWTEDVARARADEARQSAAYRETSVPKLISQLGHLGGGQGIVRTLAATIAMEQSPAAPPVQRICETAQDGYQIEYQIAKQPTPTPMIRASAPSMSRPRETHPANSSAGSQRMEPATGNPVVTGPVESPAGGLQIRLQSSDPSRLEQDLRLLAGNTNAELPPRSTLSSAVDTFAGTLSAREGSATRNLIDIAIVGRDTKEVAAAAEAIVAGPLMDRRTTAIAKHLAWIRCRESAGSRVGWLFPGQGSQYPAVPRLLSPDSRASYAERARSFLRDVDARLQNRGIEPVGDRLADPQGQLGRDVWWTQLWVLAVGAAMTDSLFHRGYRPDVVLGHSFGECTAAWAAGVMDIDQAIEFAKCRSDAVIMTRQVGGQLLSVRGEPSAVQAVIDRHKLGAVISHHNSPLSTVIAGEKQDIQTAKEHLIAAGMAAVVIHVPAAFHTPAMQPAQDLLRARFGGQLLMPPRLGFLSAVSNRFLAEPTDLMDNLIHQLTRPVCFNGALQRIVAEGCGLLIEVGPDNVLTRLAQATVDGRAICLSADDRRREYGLQQRLIDLACESFEQSPANAQTTPTPGQLPSSARGISSTHVAPESAAGSNENLFEVVDVTRNRRRPPSSEPKPSAADSSARPAIAPAPATETHATLTRATDTLVNGRSATAAPAAQADSVTVPAVDASSAPELQGARSFLFDLAVDLTGYDPDIIEFDADLEAELGVDSIKKAQLIGEIVQWADTPVDVQSMQLAQFETLNDILGILAPASTQQDSENPAPEPSPEIVADAAPEPWDEADHDVADTDESLRRLMIDLVVDQTGYDESIIDMDADMEGELGIDSIKKAQLLGELAQQYQLESLQDSGLSLADFATLESIRAFVWEQIGSTAESQGGSGSVSVSTLEKKNGVEPTLAEPVPATGTHRFVMAMRPTPRLPNMPTCPDWHGPALVLGNNSISRAILARWRADSRSSQYPIEQLDSSVSPEQLDARLDALWADGVSPHLFITTPHDDDAVWATTDAAVWQSRRGAALSNPFRLCQRWMQGLIDEDRISDATLATVVRSAGNFHFDRSGLVSSESGGLSGLTKAMLIEAWMRGYRDTPMLIIDPLPDATAADVTAGIWRELAVPSYDEEVAVGAEQRFATAACYSPLPTSTSSTTSPQITPGGNWIVAGGGRGITALTAMELASRHGLKLHLLGTAPVPQIDEATRVKAATDRPALRRQVMSRTQAQGGNPVTTWQKLEKAIEIDQTLQACRGRSIDAVYHSVDVSDVEAVNRLIEQIRHSDGPIRGVIQGAGAGQDARFDRKRPDKVEKCFRAKIDGCIALANATRRDPLDWFIGFGSISGRFGANGHTDYSAANDMLAKLIDNLQEERPDTHCVTFHWHAWGDIGMATKPEAKLALDMIGMDFMPAHEGLQHFLNEIECGGDATEVLITDRRYVRKFFPEGEETCSCDSELSRRSDRCEIGLPLPMLDPEGDRSQWQDSASFASHNVTLDPTSDRFLSEHLVQGRPTLPFVIAIEMLAEAARAGTNRGVIALHDVQAHRPLKCLTSDPISVELLPVNAQGAAPESTSPSHQRWTLVSDLRRRDGRLVEASRPHFSATIELGENVDRRLRPSREVAADDESRRSEPSDYNVDRRLRPSREVAADGESRRSEPSDYNVDRRLRPSREVAADDESRRSEPSDYNVDRRLRPSREVAADGESRRSEPSDYKVDRRLRPSREVAADVESRRSEPSDYNVDRRLRPSREVSADGESRRSEPSDYNVDRRLRPSREVAADGESRRSEPSDYNVDRRLRPSREVAADGESRRSEPSDYNVVHYQSIDAPVYHGPQFQCLRELGFTADGRTAMGVIVTPSPSHLAGENRPLRGWVISPAAMDAVLYAAGMLAYRVGGRPSLPISFDTIKIGRLPVPGEPLRVIVDCESDDENGATLRASLMGLNGDCILELVGYQIGWLG
ncbi:type I polyketide synthase [Allorhodopirellula solitaria]|uniref:type I polyketide synthase n=1 Tax=Allorhodopirellula solitaria TaxID=2527987 RepID=UPI0021BCCED4|nr:type I polyketide synthase [Allorhodopirellula solitaria]